MIHSTSLPLALTAHIDVLAGGRWLVLLTSCHPFVSEGVPVAF